MAARKSAPSLKEIKKLYNFYQKEDKHDKPKEYFKFILKHLLRDPKLKPNATILDVGCAGGDFLHYLHTQNKDWKLSGLDIIPDSVAIAKQRCSKAKYFVGNVGSPKSLPNKKFDVVCMLGVNQVFDDYTKYLNGLFQLTKKGGVIYIFGIYNRYPVDAIIRVRRAGKKEEWETGWNFFSQKTLADFFAKKKKEFKFFDWEIGIDLPVNPDDPLRSWTIKNEAGQRVITNGLQLMQSFSLIRVVNT